MSRFDEAAEVSTSELIVILCTAPDEATGEKLAGALVEERLAACVNLIPGIRSFYRWRGGIESDAEVQLLIKTRQDLFGRVASWLDEHHPYDVPEVVAIRAASVSEPYRAWALEATED